MSKLPVAFLFLAVACVDHTDDAIATTAAALEQPNGGFAMTDEIMALDQDTIDPEAAVVDPMTPTADAMVGARHRLLLAWGRMPPDRDATLVRDWSGSLTLSRGALVVARTIAFDDGDHLLPRETADTVSFVSRTRPAVDGLLLGVVDPAPGSGPLHVAYASSDGAHAYDLDLSQLASGPIAIDAGDGLRVIAIGLRDGDCDHGFMRGRWRALSSDLGVYRGVVANAAGDPIGHMRGIWGVRANGEHVMYGKLVDLDGHFRGLLVGTYDNGHWRARWLVASGDRGIAGGLYFDAPSLPGGFFAGRWADAACAQ